MQNRQTYLEWIHETGMEIPEEMNFFLQDRLKGLSREQTLARLEAEENSGQARHFIVHREGYPRTKEYVGKVVSGEIVPEQAAQRNQMNFAALSPEERQKRITRFLQVRWYAPSFEEINLTNHPDWQENLAQCAKLTKTAPAEKMIVLHSDFVEAGMVSQALKGVLFVTSALLALPSHQRDAALRHEMGRELYQSEDRGRNIFVADKLSAPKEIGVGPSIEFLSQKAVEERDRAQDFSQIAALIKAASSQQEAPTQAVSTVLRAEEKPKAPPLPDTLDRIAALLELQKQRLASQHSPSHSHWADYILHRKPKAPHNKEADVSERQS